MSSTLAWFRERLGSMRFDLPELSGSMGDLGTFVPLAISMITVCGLDAGTVLFFAGLFSVVTGFAFNQPIAVQPMKAIAAVAIAEGLAPGEIAAAGFATGALVLVLGLSGAMTWVDRVIPKPLVRGIQLGVGLKLAAKGVEMVMGVEWWGFDSRIVAIAAGLGLLLTTRVRRFPSALVLFGAGLVLLVTSHAEVFTGLQLGWDGPELILPTSAQWSTGLLQGTLPQLPLTLLNSVIAVCALSEDFFPGRGVEVRSMAASVGVMNVAGCLLGAMPVCHGSGGLAGQYRFGARTGGAMVALGIAKMALAVVFGAAAIGVLAAYPLSVLGVLLLFAGLELTLPARDCLEREPFYIAAATAAGILAVNTAVGFAIGLTAALLVARWKNDEDSSGS